MNRQRLAELRALVEAEEMSWGDVIELQSAFEQIDPATLPEPPEHAGWDDMLGELEARLPAEPPAGYRWATPEEVEANLPEAIVVPLTFDANGRRYSQDEADIAVPDTTEEDQ